jgi:predicted transcriptional regulator
MEKTAVMQKAGSGSSELYDLIQAGIDDFENGRVLSETEVVANMKNALL